MRKLPFFVHHGRMERRFPLILTVACLCCFGLTVYFGDLIRQHPAKDQFLFPPPENIERLSFGFKEVMADTFWLRWIQDADNCQTYLQPVVELEPDAKSVKQDRFFDPRHRNCDTSWSFKMLDAVTKLDPKFSIPYVAGGTSLSVLTEDYAGATILFDRGIANYPDDWNLAFRAAYHFMIGMHDQAKAAALLNHAAEHGAPPWVNALASRLFAEAGQLELALRTLTAYRKTMVGDRGVKEIDARIAKIRARLAAQ